MKSEIRVVPLGAGQDVGRSCILVEVGGRRIMLDCGMHMGFNDERRFPNFDFLAPRGNPLTDLLDCVVISHFHLDHCGALPYFSEMRIYDKPIYMTHPTKAICPILLEDYRKITVDRQGTQDFFTSEMIKSCMNKVIGVNLHETVKVDEGLEITAYYAGHVLGAAMFLIKAGEETVLYTGDYNMTPDRHLGSARVPRLEPDVLITESTYATTVRDSKRLRERDLLKQVHEVIDQGGKVLIPVFALGRAQELLILIEAYWERMGLEVPVYFTTGLAARANEYYKIYINWTNQKVKQTFVRRNLFDFKRIFPFDRAYIKKPGAMVVFASPGMLHAGQSLEIFKAWCGEPKNKVILPGYCVEGTIGNKVLSGQKVIETERGEKVRVRCGVSKVSFSAHADSKGIMQLIRQTMPRNVVLVHGEAHKMDVLKEKIEREFAIPCRTPGNGTTISLSSSMRLPLRISKEIVDEVTTQFAIRQQGSDDGLSLNLQSSDNEVYHHLRETEGLEAQRLHSDRDRSIVVNGLIVMGGEQGLRFLTIDDGFQLLGWQQHRILLQCRVKLPDHIDYHTLKDGLMRCFHSVYPKESIQCLRDYISIGTGGPRVEIKREDESPKFVAIVAWNRDCNDDARRLLTAIRKLFMDDKSVADG